ncbi:MAG: CapA family protein, partial [Actinomycetota bacterium]|nr:CapA family protein [Actinomycetota bacterium]
ASTAAPAARTATGAPVTLAFGGDVHFEGSLRTRLADPSSALASIAPALSRADLAMVNLETAVTTRGTPAAKQYVFRAPPAAFSALKEAGVDVASMANNHGEDYGETGLRDSLDAAAAVGLPVVGIGLTEDAAFAPWRRTINGQRVAVIGATQVLDDDLAAAWTAGPDKPGLASAKDVPRLLATVRTARASADTVVVYLHWGTEQVSCPTPAQRTLGSQLVAAGADVVVGSHAHLLLGGGYLDGAYVDYGLGNFVFYATTGPAIVSGVLTLTTRGRAVTGAEWTPALLSDGVPRPLTGGAAASAVQAWSALRACAGLDAAAP